MKCSNLLEGNLLTSTTNSTLWLESSSINSSPARVLVPEGIDEFISLKIHPLLPSSSGQKLGHLIEGLLNLHQLELAEIAFPAAGEAAAAKLNSV